jgi:type I restriction enzyme S subunit
VLDGQFSLGRQHRISHKKYAVLNKFSANPLDVLITVMSTVGRCCVLPEDIEPAIITKHVYRISCDLAKVNPFFIAYCLRGCPDIQDQLQSQIRGATRPAINGSILKDLIVPIPSLVEQHEIVRRVDQLFSLADQVEARYAKAKQYVDSLKQSILAKAFRGELVPQDPNDEPATALLERIREARGIKTMDRSKPRATKSGTPHQNPVL